MKSKELQLLDAVKDMLIEFANKEGISLEHEFGSRDKFAQFVIGFTIRNLVEVCNMTISEAYNAVMGEDAYQQLAESVWQQLQG